MTVFEFTSVLGLFVGPVTAIVVQLRVEASRKLRDARTQTLRTLIGTRHLPSDPAYSTAINMIPIDYNRVPKVMAAYDAYWALIRNEPEEAQAQDHRKLVLAKQTRLIFEMAKLLGYDLPETDIQTNAYVAGGFQARDNLMLTAWEAWPRIAVALERNNEMLSSTLNSGQGGQN